MKKRSAGRPKKEPDEVLVDLPSKVSPDTIEVVEQIAEQLDRPRGWVARKLLLRGIEVYLRDVQTMRPEDAIQVGPSMAGLKNGNSAPEDDDDDLPDEFEIAPYEEKDDEPAPLQRKGGR